MINRPEKRELIENILGDFGFTLRWRYDEYWADIEVFEKVAQECSDPPKTLYESKGATTSEQHAYSIDEAESYLEGFIKWDSCTQLTIGRIHWDGVYGYRRHCDLIQYLFIRSQQLMEKADHSLFGEWQSVSENDG